MILHAGLEVCRMAIPGPATQSLGSWDCAQESLSTIGMPVVCLLPVCISKPNVLLTRNCFAPLLFYYLVSLRADAFAISVAEVLTKSRHSEKAVLDAPDQKSCAIVVLPGCHIIAVQPIRLEAPYPSPRAPYVSCKDEQYLKRRWLLKLLSCSSKSMNPGILHCSIWMCNHVLHATCCNAPDAIGY